jgi:transcriptional regulator with XRE-family HTH domain
MARYARPRPARLTEKLLQIRTLLGLSQNGMLEKLGMAEDRLRTSISYYEVGGEPPLPILLEYARLAGVCLDVLVDDELDLPASLPAAHRRDSYHKRRKSSVRKGSRGKQAG